MDICIVEFGYICKGEDVWPFGVGDQENSVADCKLCSVYPRAECAS